MKNNSLHLRSLVSAIILSAAIFSCSKEVSISENDHRSLEHISITKSDIIIDSSLLVTQEDIALYAQIQSLKGGGKKAVDIIPVKTQGLLTSYLIQYESGWEIVSADKRGPVILAVGEEGTYEEDDMSPAAIEWMENLNNEIAYRWELNLPVNMDNEREKECVEFWNNVTCKERDLSIVTKMDPGLPVSHREIVSVEVIHSVYDSIPHLTSTLWSQGSPYNAACPFMSGSTTTRVPAGCGAIAVSQMLFYLHGLLGAPEYAPSYAICTGDINNYSFNIPAPNSTTIWSSMKPAGGTPDSSYVLVADAACRLNTSFTNTSGGTNFSSYPGYFEDYGFDSCYTLGLVADTLTTNLLKDLPIVMSAFRTDTWDQEHGHAFLVDGYVRYRDEIHTTFREEWEPSPTHPTPLPVEYVVISYLAPQIELIKMNWGWGNFPHKDDSYSLTGSWLATEGYIYDHNYRMLSGFSVQSE